MSEGFHTIPVSKWYRFRSIDGERIYLAVSLFLLLEDPPMLSLLQISIVTDTRFTYHLRRIWLVTISLYTYRYLVYQFLARRLFGLFHMLVS